MDLKPEEYRDMIKRSTNMQVKRILSVTIEPAVTHGANNCSVLFRGQLCVQLDSNDVTNLNVIVKLAPTSEQSAMYDYVIRQNNMFVVEEQVYETVLKTIESILQTGNSPEERMWPQFLGYKTNSVILLEDLKIKGYTSLNIEEQMDYDHAILVMKEIGKFHASTLAAMETGINPKEFLSHWIWNHPVTMNLFFKQPLRRLSSVMKETWGKEWSDASDKFYACSNRIQDKLNEIQTFEPDRLNVINHGDLWTSNVLFKHDPSGFPTSLKFVDFQISTYNTFAMDLTYFLYTSVQAQVRRNKYDELIEAYRHSLNDAMAKNGLDFSGKTTRQAIRAEMDRLKFWAFLLLISLQAMWVVKKRLLISADDLLQNASGENVEPFNFLYRDSQVRQSVEDDFKEFLSSGII